jgi:hypothetical protein
VLGLVFTFSGGSASSTTSPTMAANSRTNNPFPGAPDGPAIPVAPPAAIASITFAESVDRDTLTPSGVGDNFPVGQVHMIVRGNKAFDDTKMIVYFSREGAIAEQVLGDYTVDPKWNLYTVTINLNSAGTYIIKAKTASGNLIAEGKLTVR